MERERIVFLGREGISMASELRERCFRWRVREKQQEGDREAERLRDEEREEVGS
jgi:hypothetical protein